ncbi:hypothetical protein MKY59_20995 [Paenibacillus sp. FSL W8-0426]|uniref:hypothetical protein n=1 Tax=Paenibacillus sp. FSL W8-0426 TaxID=2921714 RepID=UPI0030DAEB3B
MANVRVVKIPVELDKPRNIVFDLNAFIELEEIYGSKKEALEALQTGGLKHIRAWLWAGLVHEDRSLTVEQVGRIFSDTDPEDIIEISDKILRSATGNLPESKN